MNLNYELAQPEYRGRTSGEETPQADVLNRKGKVVESDVLESVCQEKVGWRKNGSSTEASSSMSEKDMVQAKTKTQTVKSRQTQSGPLMPGAVLSHSVSERVRISERFVMMYLDLFCEAKLLTSVSFEKIHFPYALVIWIFFWWCGQVAYF